MTTMGRLTAVFALMLTAGITSSSAAPAALRSEAKPQPSTETKLAPAPLPFLPNTAPPAQSRLSCNGVRYFLCPWAVDDVTCPCSGFFCNGVFICGKQVTF